MRFGNTKINFKFRVGWKEATRKEKFYGTFNLDCNFNCSDIFF